MLYLTPPQPPALNPPDSLLSLPVTSVELQEVASSVSFVSPELATPDYFIETIAQVEMKIFPNPTTEKITLQISNMETLQKGILQLFTLNGQLLHTRLYVFKQSFTTACFLVGCFLFSSSNCANGCIPHGMQNSENCFFYRERIHSGNVYIFF